MKIIKVDINAVAEYERNNRFIPILIGQNYNYYLVNDDQPGYEQVDNIPNINNIVQGNLEGIVQYASYMSNIKLKEEILDLESNLEKSDYKILKMYEYSIAGKPAPYEITDLHNTRQTYRDQINFLQSQIKDIKTWDELSNIVIDNRKNVENPN